MNKALSFTIICCLVSILSFAQNRTVGTLQFSEDALEGYTFFSPFSSRSAFLIDNCGNLINKWDQGTLPGLSAYFLENGQMLRTYKVSPVGPFISASNAGGVALVDWNNNTIWSYELNTATELSHHDAVLMPNGNILMLTWELIQQDELIQLGRNPNEIAPQGFSWGERIIEIQRMGTNEAEIIWEWRVKDHLVQDRDSTLSNFGTVSEHPELFDINLPDINSSNSHSSFDYNHFNSIDYNEDLDQILISVRNSDELWIIDHSTTTEEAASHVGGNSGKGGDILYRWGNASAYQNALVSDQNFFGQHGVHWIKDGPEKDKILIYNNGNGRPGPDFSTIEILSPPILPNGSYEKEENEPYGPLISDWIYGDESSQRFYSPFLSNAQYLPNGNILINAGSLGNIFEINPNKEIAWEYEIPLFGDFPATQGDNINNNSTFRAYKFPLDYSGFSNVDIQVGLPIEEEPLVLEVCEITNSSNSIVLENLVSISQNSSGIQINNESSTTLNAQLIDLAGRKLKEFDCKLGTTTLNNASITSGIYILHFITPDGIRFSRKVVL